MQQKVCLLPEAPPFTESKTSFAYSTYRKISEELGELHIKGPLFSVHYEPLHPNFPEIVRIISKNSRVEIVIERDELTSKNVSQLFELGASYFVA